MGSLVEGGMASNGKNVYRLIVGSAIYPSKFLDYCGLAANLYNYNVAYRASGVFPEPWDVRCRWVFLQNGRNTESIKSYWKSVNYQWNGENIVFFAEDTESQAIQGVTCPDRLVSREALVVHGCKDGSLHRMAIAGFPMPSDSTGLNIPSNSMGLEQGGGQNVPALSIPDQECDFLYASVGDKIEIIHIPVREPDTTLQPHTSCHGMSVNVETMVQNVTNDALSPTVCNKTSDKKCNSPDVANCQKTPVKRKNKSPSKANKKKKRNLSPEERQRRSEAMRAILARKAERKAQGVV
jgi:hypothetical protein